MKIATAYCNWEDNFSKKAHIPSVLLVDALLSHSPKYTIAIPVFRRHQLLKEALESALNQKDYLDYEILVLDDDPSRDCPTERMMLNYGQSRFRYFKNSENMGAIDNWNRLYALARGEYVVMLHDDDLLDASFLKTMDNVIRHYPEYAIFYPPCRFFRDEFNPDSLQSSTIGFRGLHLKAHYFLSGNIVGPPVGMTVKKDRMLSLKGFRNRMYPSADYDFYVYASKQLNTLKIFGNPLCYYRIGSNESLNEGTMLGFIRNDLIIKSELLKTITNNRLVTKLFKSYFKVCGRRYIARSLQIYTISESNIEKWTALFGFTPGYPEYIPFLALAAINKAERRLRMFSLTRMSHGS